MTLPRLVRRIAQVLPILIAWPVVANCTGTTPEPSSPGHACTDIGCVDGLHVTLAPSGGLWTKGHYTFEITTPLGTTTCEGALPLPACEAGRALSCSGPPVSIGESGCALPPDQHGFASIDLASGPADVTIVIRKDGAELVRKSITPGYRVTSPNGPDCEPTCRQASDTLAF